MSFIVGPTTWWIRSKEAVDYYARICPLGTILPDGSTAWCRAGGLAWIVAPNCTQVSSTWAGGQYNNTLVGDKCCICEWPAVCSQLISCGFNPCDWFIPNQTVLFNSYCCRAFWDTCSLTTYWSSTEFIPTNACCMTFFTGAQSTNSKSFAASVRSVRCISL